MLCYIVTTQSPASEITFVASSFTLMIFTRIHSVLNSYYNDFLICKLIYGLQSVTKSKLISISNERNMLWFVILTFITIYRISQYSINVNQQVFYRVTFSYYIDSHNQQIYCETYNLSTHTHTHAHTHTHTHTQHTHTNTRAHMHTHHTHSYTHTHIHVHTHVHTHTHTHTHTRTNPHTLTGMHTQMQLTHMTCTRIHFPWYNSFYKSFKKIFTHFYYLIQYVIILICYIICL